MAYSIKYGSTTIESKLNITLDTNSGDIPRVSTGGRQGIESVPTLIILRTALRIRELNI